MKDLRIAAERAGMKFEDWSVPTHVPAVVALLHRFVHDAVSSSNSPSQAVDELERICRESLDAADAATQDELASACEVLRDMLASGATVVEAVAACKATPTPDAPVSPGLHLLTGHKGKGQEFDWVCVVGMEDGHVPDFRNATDPEELRVLHVMASRACYGLIFTYSRNTHTKFGWRANKPSRWLSLLRSNETTADIG